ncbi:hypothetical protein N7499_000136 [Penicillium canescens]|uniref:DUF3752 domain-containing protein n=1 Tax=Penicillium canescens TaxID=5083 RepID=A0AAD6IGA3_PENCN|nr:uncharacterized protein N7446_011664 [Penicillium canescens]KAJ6004072.1 hypothetical protein N7522_005717 [Penicillium canescens]KAJ6028995.1 hypothetical protein N7444_011982 [Penicillium canescens]KAJ6047428.1 hypothetical protein N7460_003575 [Penicillium canescens]KAJ6048981.1 hypothetical protein N7446_011664 [Penicillium canescens]KAJ6100506.1 hypothetical protein N7499_000136 [Penicillium canescens]
MADKRKFDDDHSVSKRRVIGPSLPTSTSDSDSDSDDDFGPTLPPPSGATPIPVPEAPKVVEAKESQRDQWMLQPPAQSDWATKIDPTQLRNRKFNSGKSATAPKKMDASWVETPEERMKRLQDAVMGVGASGQNEKQTAASDTKLMEDKIKKYREMTGKGSRLESSEDQKEEDDDPSARAFDREKDMAISSRISNAQRREMVKKAGDYTSRFSKGNFL